MHPTSPMGRYVSQPLTVKCESIFDIRKFLCGCTYSSDEDQFGMKDYWQAPEEFEQTRRGDCDCFALWTWRQFLALGFNARFVVGRESHYGYGHAWVQFSKDGKDFLVEPTGAWVGISMPRVSTLRYRPYFSVAWDGTKISFYSHEARQGSPPLREIVALVPDWLIFWIWVWVRKLIFLPFKLYRRLTVNAGSRSRKHHANR